MRKVIISAVVAVATFTGFAGLGTSEAQAAPRVNYVAKAEAECASNAKKMLNMQRGVRVRTISHKSVAGFKKTGTRYHGDADLYKVAKWDAPGTHNYTVKLRTTGKNLLGWTVQYDGFCKVSVTSKAHHSKLELSHFHVIKL